MGERQANVCPSKPLLIFRFGLRAGCSFCFVAIGAGANPLNCLSGDVAERLKAAVC